VIISTARVTGYQSRGLPLNLGKDLRPILPCESSLNPWLTHRDTQLGHIHSLFTYNPSE